jgi:hypothetical protein
MSVGRVHRIALQTLRLACASGIRCYSNGDFSSGELFQKINILGGKTDASPESGLTLKQEFSYGSGTVCEHRQLHLNFEIAFWPEFTDTHRMHPFLA